MDTYVDLAHIVFYSVNEASMPPKGGIRQHLKLDESSNPPAGALLSGSEIQGGVRQRLGIGSDTGAASSSGPRATGGAKRRVEQHVQHDSEAKSHKPLNKKLRRDWLRGELASQRLLEYAAAAEEQGARGAGIGNWETPKNCHRTVVRAIGYPDDAPPISWMEITGKKGGKVQQAIVDPIDTFERLVAAGGEKFERRLSGPPAAIAAYWCGMREHILYRAIRDRIDVEKTVALTLHGDGAPTTKIDGLFTVSWASIHVVGSGTIPETRNVFAIVRKSDLGPGALQMVFSRMAWSMNALMEGRMPSHDWQGRKHPEAGRVLAGGYRAAAMHVKGDWEFFCQAFGFPAPTSTPNMCWMCSASPNIPALSFTDGSRTAGWRGGMRSHEGYLQKLEDEGSEVPALFKIHSLRMEGIMIDVLHAVDLGVCSHVVGNTLFEIQEAHPEWGGKQEERVERLDSLLNKHYKATKEQYKLDGHLTLERVRKPGDWPALRGKAAAIRHMISFVLALATENNSGSEHDRWRLGVVQLLDRFYKIHAAEPMFPSTEAKAELKRISVTFMGLYRKLSFEALHAKRRAWKMTPKFHAWVHLCEHQSWINAKLSWTYGDESLQGLIKEVARSTHASTMSYMTTLKWICTAWEE